jgi:hypothetical protein
LEKRIEQGQRLDVTQSQKFGCFLAATPLARVDFFDRHAVLSERSTNTPGLLPAGSREVALGRAITELKRCWVANAWCHGVAHEDRLAASRELGPEISARRRREQLAAAAQEQQ